MERVITVSASESPEQCSTVQSALLRIFDRIASMGRNTCPLFNQPSQTTARALVFDSQIGCLGGVVKEIMNITRARIQILIAPHPMNCWKQKHRFENYLVLRELQLFY